jgi:hypothetical protein
VNVSTLFRIASDPVARVWGGLTDLIIPADTVETAPALYLGGGELVDVPDLQMLLNGTAQRLDITISGVSPQALSLAQEDAASVDGALVHIGKVYFDDALQIDSVEWLAVLFAGPLTVASEPSATGRSRSISLSIGTDFTQRSKAPLGYFTDADQRRRAPDDRIFDHVAGITSGTARSYGPR